MVVVKELIFRFPLWVDVVVMKELIYNSFYLGGRVGGGWRMVVLKELIFNSFYFGGGCGGLERTDF